MARVKRRKSGFNPKLRQALLVGALLSLSEAFYLYFLAPSDDKPKTAMQAIERTLMKKMMKDNLPIERQEMVRTQLAISDYMSKHNGEPPPTLETMIPEYFERLPIDFSTGKPFTYKIDGKKYMLGDQKAKSSLTGAALDANEEAKNSLLALISRDPSLIPPYDPTGKRDPFKPTDLAPDTKSNGAKTPLESLPLSSLSYSAFLASGDEPKALVEDSNGRGYTLTKGIKVGQNNGEVVDITPSKVIVVETEFDFTGEKKSKTIELAIGARGTKE